MGIKKLEVTNWMNFDYKKIDFSEGINLIIGPNGSGKSNLLEAIYFCLYGNTSKVMRLNELNFQKIPEYSFKLFLEFNNFKIRRYLISNNDLLESLDGNHKVKGRDGITKWINDNFLDKKIFDILVFNGQFQLLDLIDTSPAEKEKLFNTILKLESLIEFFQNINQLISKLSSLKSEYVIILKRLELRKASSRDELVKKYYDLKKELENLQTKKEHILKIFSKVESVVVFYEKYNALLKYLRIRQKIKDFKNDYELLNKLKNLVLTRISNKDTLNERLKFVNEKIKRILTLQEEGKCIFCERILTKTDLEMYQKQLSILEKEKRSLEENLIEHNNEINKMKSAITNLEKKLSKINYNLLFNEQIKLRQFILSKESFRKLRLKADEYFHHFEYSKKEFEVLKEEVEKIDKEINNLKVEITSIERSLKLGTKGFEKEIEIYNNKVLEITEFLEKLKNFKELYSKGVINSEIRKIYLDTIPFDSLFKVFQLGTLHIDEEFNIFIDGFNIKACSGGQKIIVNFLLKILFLQLYNVDFIILDEPTVYLDKERILFLKEFLLTIRNFNIINQIILVTHEEILKDIGDNVIFLERKEKK